MKKDMSLEGLRWSCDSGSALYDTPPNGRSRTGWGGEYVVTKVQMLFETTKLLAKKFRKKLCEGTQS